MYIYIYRIDILILNKTPKLSVKLVIPLAPPDLPLPALQIAGGCSASPRRGRLIYGYRL